MIHRILIANRGEIAVRIIRACHEMGIETVAVYSTADKNSLAVQMANQSVCIGPPPANQSYLQSNQILSAALCTQADAIHPGFGFLAENSEFAHICEEMGIEFIGPSSRSLQELGHKATAKQIMKAHGIPVVSGPDKTFVDAQQCLAEVRSMGFPLIIKAVAGGGGRGIRVIHHEADFCEAFLSASQEAFNAFGNAEMYVEKFLTNPKHIEFQMMADKHGNCVCLGERDCSTQRRKQKLIEESPSPVIAEASRQQMSEKLVQAFSQMKYWNAGTVEFLYEQGHFFFMEVNTRIQVEHPVTEMITGTDLIQMQIRIAQGDILPFKQKDIHRQGHAIEARINAEDPSRQFMPSAGKTDSVYFPGGPGVRVDSALFAQAIISPFYDSMLAKIIVHADTRAQAIARMIRALHELQITGVATNRDFLLNILTSQAFLDGNYPIHYVEEMLNNAEKKNL